MIAVWGIVLGLVLGKVRGGTFENLGKLQLRWLVLAFVALGIQLLTFPTPWWAHPPLAEATRGWHLFSYALIVAFLGANRRLVPLWGIAAGVMMNLVVITANGGLMPTNPDALSASGNQEVAERLAQSREATLGNVVVMSADTRLNVLGDWLYLPQWIPFGDAFSLGDVALMVGVAWLIQRAMVSKHVQPPKTDSGWD
ncbi:MAG: DUF5317 domain-containing protein [Alkalispirochaeta sp.]